MSRQGSSEGLTALTGSAWMAACMTVDDAISWNVPSIVDEARAREVPKIQAIELMSIAPKCLDNCIWPGTEEALATV